MSHTGAMAEIEGAFSGLEKLSVKVSAWVMEVKCHELSR
jgi:hypothetical protein